MATKTLAARGGAIQVPSVGDFGDADFLSADDLIDVMADLVREYPAELAWLTYDGWRVKILWKRKGGASGGRATLGKTTLASGLTAFFADCDWIVWLAAEHVRMREFTDRQIAALLFHELLHCALKGDEDDVYPTVKGHDFEAFNAEIQHFGAWKSDLAEAGAVFTQLRLIPDVPE